MLVFLSAPCCYADEVCGSSGRTPTFANRTERASWGSNPTLRYRCSSSIWLSVPSSLPPLWFLSIDQVIRFGGLRRNLSLLLAWDSFRRRKSFSLCSRIPPSTMLIRTLQDEYADDDDYGRTPNITRQSRSMLPRPLCQRNRDSFHHLKRSDRRLFPFLRPRHSRTALYTPKRKSRRHGRRSESDEIDRGVGAREGGDRIRITNTYMNTL